MHGEQVDESLSPMVVTVENIGGIDAVERTIDPGLTVLAGRNATNRTSFLQALMAAFGSHSDQISLKSNATEGKVTVDVEDGPTYTRRLRRAGGTTVMDGDPYTDDPELLDLYAFLLRENPVRRAVERGEGLYDLLMEPIDTGEIERQIRQEADRKDRIDQQLERRQEEKRRLPELEQERQELERELASLREREQTLEEKRKRLESEQPAEEVRKRSDELDEKLRELEAERDRIDREIDRKEAKIEGAKAEIAESTVPDLDWDELEQRHERLEAELDQLQTEIEETRSIRSSLSTGLQAAQTLRDNRFSVDEALDTLDEPPELPEGPLTGGEADAESDTGAVTDKLVTGPSARCLACGSTVPEQTIDQIIDQYRALNQGLASKTQSLEQQEAEIQDELDDIERQIDEHRQVLDQIEAAEQSIDEAGDRIDQLREERAEITAEIDRLSSEISDIADGDIDETTKQYNEVRDELRDLQVDIDRTESSLAETEAEIERIESRVDDIDALEADREDTIGRLETLRTKVEQTERDLVSRFNETIETVLRLLGYANIERIWFERRETPAGSETVFDLHIVRDGEDGVYECELQHLSESERTVTGLVVALTGYLVHDVDEHCPVMLLDSVEMIDSDRIASLLEYLDEKTQYLTVALLPEDASRVLAAETVDGSEVTISESP